MTLSPYWRGLQLPFPALSISAKPLPDSAIWR